MEYAWAARQYLIHAGKKLIQQLSYRNDSGIKEMIY